MYVSSYSGACSAGAVYGVLSFLARAINGCIICIHRNTSKGPITVFGSFEYIQPEPITISEKQYQEMLRAQQHALVHLIGRKDRLKEVSWRAAARLSSFLFWLSKDERKELKLRLREVAATREDQSHFPEDFLLETSS